MMVVPFSKSLLCDTVNSLRVYQAAQEWPQLSDVSCKVLAAR